MIAEAIAIVIVLIGSASAIVAPILLVMWGVTAIEKWEKEVKK